MKLRLVFPLMLLVLSLSGCECIKRWDVLSVKDQILLNRILIHWETWMPEKKAEGKAPLITFEDLYSDLGGEERELIGRVLAIDPRKSFGFSAGGGPASGGQGSHLGGPPEWVRFKRLKGQKVKRNGKQEKIGPQYLPEDVYKAYKTMMKAMKKDLGKKLLVESGYRSPAYQLYTFLYYLPKHHYSLVETGHWIALPGYSEHGAPHQQAIDFINEEGINGEDVAEEFERLPEYEWLVARAGEFGFELSYPRGKKGITFEPWHWRYRALQGED